MVKSVEVGMTEIVGSNAWGQLDPDGRVIARLVAPAVLRIDPCRQQARPKARTQQKEVHAEACVAPMGLGVDPERVEILATLRVQVAGAVDPALSEQSLVSGSGLGLEHGVEAPGAGVVDVLVGGNDIEVP